MADRTIRAVLTGDNASLIRSMEEGAGAADVAGKAIGDHMQAATDRTAGLFQRLGNQMSSFGLPFSEHVSKIGEKLGEAETKGQKFTSAMSTLGGVTLAAVGAGLIGVGAESVHMAADFQESMTALVTGAGESKKNIGLVSEGILNMAGEVGISADHLAQGMFLVESAGYHGAAGLSVLKAAAEGAAVGNANMETVANAVTTALTDYHIPAARANAVTSALVETVASGKMHMEDLAGSIGKVMPVAAALGVTFADVGGAIATMTNQGLTARFAATHLQNTLLALSAPSKVAITAMESVGLSSQEVRNELDQHGLAGTLQLIEEHVGATFPRNSVAYVTAMKNMLGGVTGYSTALMLSGKNMGQFQTNVTSIGQALHGQTKEVQGFSDVQGDLAFQMKQARAEAEALAIKFGDFLLPKVEDLEHAVAGSVQWLEKHTVVAKILAGVIGGVLGTAVTVFAYEKAKTFTTSVASMIDDATGLANKLLGTTIPALTKAGQAARTTGDDVQGAGAKSSVAGTEMQGMGTKAVIAGDETAGMGEKAVIAGDAEMAMGEKAVVAGEAEVTAGTDAEAAGVEFGTMGSAAGGALGPMLALAGGAGYLSGKLIFGNLPTSGGPGVPGAGTGNAVPLPTSIAGSGYGSFAPPTNYGVTRMTATPGATGLTVDGPSLLLAGEGGGREFLIPESLLDVGASGGHTSPLPQLSPGSPPTAGAGTDTTGPTTVILQLDGKEVARVLMPYLRVAGQTTSRALVNYGLG